MSTTPLRGFTLMEMLTVVAIIGIVTGALTYAIVNVYRNNAYIFESTAAVENARRGLSLSLEHIREASYADDGNYPLGSIASTSITFYSDIDEDGGVERVRIYALNNTLYRVTTNAGGNPPSYTGQTPATSTIASFLRNGPTEDIFTYYDDTGAVLPAISANLGDVRSVAVTIMTDLNPDRAPNVLTLTGSATLRNLRDE